MLSFSELGVCNEIVAALDVLGFEAPTPVQKLVIPELLHKQSDYIVLAQTGTGKTAAFGLPLLQRLKPGSNLPQALILSPTRELCVQIASDLLNYSTHLPGVKTTAVYGGADISRQIRSIREGTQIIVATPGRLLDLLKRKVINTELITQVVLDEADEMLNMGFQEDLESILSEMVNKESTWLFSATMSEEVRRIAMRYMSNPKELTAGRKNTGAETIEHVYYTCKHSDRYGVLKRIVSYYPDIFGLIFCRTRVETKEIAEMMNRDGFHSDSLHGDMSQSERDRVMARYRSGKLQLLIATDVAARGIDVSNITHVINYSLPDDIEVYTHRSGRTGRAGKKGISVCLVSPKEISRLKQIEKKTGSIFRAGIIPGFAEVVEKQILHDVEKLLSEEANKEELKSYIPALEKLTEGLTKEELVLKLAALTFHKFRDEFKSEKDFENVGEDRKKSKDKTGGMAERGHFSGSTDMSRLFVSVGKKDDIGKHDVLEFLHEVAGLNKSNIGKIDIDYTYSFIEVSTSRVKDVFDAFRETRVNGRSVRVDHASEAQLKRLDSDFDFPKGAKGGKGKHKKY